MWGMSLMHWVIVIGVVVLLFGRGRISGLMADIGEGIKKAREIGAAAQEAPPCIRHDEEV
jgi:sec-independent protein translocase protein TatA